LIASLGERVFGEVAVDKQDARASHLQHHPDCTLTAFAETGRCASGRDDSDVTPVAMMHTLGAEYGQASEFGEE
jgi:hypothetical protein